MAAIRKYPQHETSLPGSRHYHDIYDTLVVRRVSNDPNTSRSISD